VGCELLGEQVAAFSPPYSVSRLRPAHQVVMPYLGTPRPAHQAGNDLHVAGTCHRYPDSCSVCHCGRGYGCVCPRAFIGSRYPHPLQVLRCKWPCLSARPSKRPDILVNKLDLSQLVTRLSCSGSASSNLHLSPYRTRVQKGDIVKNALQQEAREDGIFNFEKKQKQICRIISADLKNSSKSCKRNGHVTNECKSHATYLAYK
jgi:hypothetical protein